MRRDIANNLSIGGGGLTWRHWFYSEKRSPACEVTQSSNQYFPSFLLHLLKTCCSSLSILLALSLPFTWGALDLLPTPWPKTSSLENLISAAPAENALRQHQGITSSQVNWSINTRSLQWASYSTYPRYPNMEKEVLLSFWLGFEVVHDIKPCYDWGQGGQEDHYHRQPQRWWRAIWNVDNTFSSVEQSSNRSIFPSLACLGLRLEGEFNRSTIK